MSARGRRWVTVAGGLLILVILGGLLVWIAVVPGWIVDRAGGAADAAAPITRAERLRVENEIRSTLFQGAAGLLAVGGVAVGAVATLRQIRASCEGHTIGLFTKAIDQLAGDQISVRQGGIYALELLAGLDPRYRGAIHALLTAFARQHAPWPPTRPHAELTAQRARYHAGLADDIGAALGALGRAEMIEPVRGRSWNGPTCAARSSTALPSPAFALRTPTWKAPAWLARDSPARRWRTRSCAAPTCPARTCAGEPGPSRPVRRTAGRCGPDRRRPRRGRPDRGWRSTAGPAGPAVARLIGALAAKALIAAVIGHRLWSPGA